MLINSNLSAFNRVCAFQKHILETLRQDNNFLLDIEIRNLIPADYVDREQVLDYLTTIINKLEKLNKILENLREELTNG